MSDFAMLQQKYELLRPHLNELGLRMCAAADALVLGRGGVSAISKASHLSRTTIYAGLSELKKLPATQVPSSGHIRKPGGGRKRLAENHPELLQALEHLVAPATRGDPESPATFQRIMIRSGYKPEEAHRIWIKMNKWQSVDRKEVRFVMGLQWFRKLRLIFLNDFTKKPCEAVYNH